jgi:hypothetical protein
VFFKTLSAEKWFSVLLGYQMLRVGFNTFYRRGKISAEKLFAQKLIRASTSCQAEWKKSLEIYYSSRE